VLVYLFSDQGGSKTLAYSTDVTGRNIPRPAADTKWHFVSAVPEKDLHQSGEATRNLRQRGFYVFDR
jgi:hypothetical protein